MFPYQDPLFGKRYVYQATKIDEESLREIAAKTGGKYFRAQSGEELEGIYDLIDKLEKTEVKVAAHIQYKELFHYFVLAGLGLLLLELILANTIFRKLP
jgi:Ca-activated chloride channel family protein